MNDKSNSALTPSTGYPDAQNASHHLLDGNKSNSILYGSTNFITIERNNGWFVSAIII